MDKSEIAKYFKVVEVINAFQNPAIGPGWHWHIKRPGHIPYTVASYIECSEVRGYATSEDAMQAANRWLEREQGNDR